MFGICSSNLPVLLMLQIWFSFLWFKCILLPNLIQQWGWVTRSHNLICDPFPTIYTDIRAYKHALTSENAYE